MPWKCPACQMPIRHDRDVREPRPGIVYRCHLCRLELVFNAEAGRLVPVRQEPESGNQ